MKHFKAHILVFCLFISLICFAQNPKVDQARANYIAQKLQLTEAESQKFWPLYNEYVDKLKQIRKERRKLFSQFQYSLNPADAEEFTKKYIQLENAESLIKQEYIQKFRQVIGVIKTAHFIKAEEEFRLELVKILKSD
ncbi:MAG: hypothetical protein KatS3mg027_1489 [Bacteroidia bacterium]|nr:MAG: hypothetical protein KatS3mg027_1489 [Bacteroidia bacterium]